MNIDVSDAFGIAPPGGPQITFHKYACINQFKSLQAGTSVYDTFDFIKIETPGENQIVDRKINSNDVRMYPTQWAQYQNAQEQVASGTPLTFLFPAEPDIVETLKGFKFHTIEQLAEAHDTALQAIPMGAFEFRTKAQKFLVMSKDAAKFHQIEKSLQDKDYKLKEQAETIAVMKQQIEGLMARGVDDEIEKRGPGRPRKEAVTA